MKPGRAERIRKHGLQLLAIFPNAKERDPIALCKKLRRLEIRANQAAVDLCNITDYQTKANAIFESVSHAVRALLMDGPSVIINRDPRGSALKIDDAWMRSHPDSRLHTDMGGYGIIAPEID